MERWMNGWMDRDGERETKLFTYGTNAPRLRADDGDGLPPALGLLQQVLRHLRGLPGSRLALDEAHR